MRPGVTLAILDAGQADPGVDTRIAAARRRIAEADVKIERYRVALETGGDPRLINRWIADVQGSRLAAETELATLDQPEQVTTDDLAQLIDDIRGTWGDMEAALNSARPEDKASLLTSLGVAVSYDPAERTARVTCTPRVREKSCRRTESPVTYTTDPQVTDPPAERAGPRGGDASEARSGRPP